MNAEAKVSQAEDALESAKAKEGAAKRGVEDAIRAGERANEEWDTLRSPIRILLGALISVGDVDYIDQGRGLSDRNQLLHRADNSLKDAQGDVATAGTALKLAWAQFVADVLEAEEQAKNRKGALGKDYLKQMRTGRCCTCKREWTDKIGYHIEWADQLPFDLSKHDVVNKKKIK